jgi:hypothetical protein
LKRIFGTKAGFVNIPRPSESLVLYINLKNIINTDASAAAQIPLCRGGGRGGSRIEPGTFETLPLTNKTLQPFGAIRLIRGRFWPRVKKIF